VLSAEDVCPYVGLQPYTDAERDYFFGRERDQRVISSNLYAASLTILYGESGVGKSSVLLAGVVPYLRSQPRSAVVVFREWQRPDFLEAIKSECLKAVELARQQPLDITATLPLDDLLCASAQALGGPILLLFDQFEEYFLYHPDSGAGTPFDSEFARDRQS
jgi:conflict system STAND superfamily ATPase